MSDGFYLIAEDTFYGARGGGMLPSFPSMEAEIIYLLWEGDILATAYRVSGMGRYANTPEPGPSTLLYLTWQDCLLDEVKSGEPDADTLSEIKDTINEGW